jgi:hypothetical protein
VAWFEDNKPLIKLPGLGRELKTFAEDLGDVLAGHEIYRRMGVAVWLKEGAMSPMSPQCLRSWVQDHLTTYTTRKNPATGQDMLFSKTMPVGDAEGVLASKQFLERLRPIERVNPVAMPTLRHDGRLEVLPEGYDPESETLTLPGGPPVNTGLGLEESKLILDDLLGEFCWADAGRSKAVHLSAMLTLFGLGLMPRGSLRPCFVYSANDAGAGKGLLIKIACTSVLGSTPLQSMPKDDDEMKKTLLAEVIECAVALVFDNCKRTIAGDALEGFLTAQQYKGRILGMSATGRGFNNSTMFISANGAKVSPDMRRRCLVVDLRQEYEKPEDQPIKRWLEEPRLKQPEMRTRILSALYGLIRHWHGQGMPPSTKQHGSFPDWTHRIAAIVETAGYGSPVEVAQNEIDLEAADMKLLVAALAERHPGQWATFADIVQVCRASELFPAYVPETGDLDQRSKTRLGMFLNKYTGRLVGAHRFLIEGEKRSKRFKAQPLGPEPPKPLPEDLFPA